MQTKALDDIDRKILAALQTDGRISLADLSAKVGLSPSPCLRRIRMLERVGIIARYAAVLSQDKVGLPVSVFVSIKLEVSASKRWSDLTKRSRNGPRCSSAI